MGGKVATGWGTDVAVGSTTGARLTGADVGLGFGVAVGRGVLVGSGVADATAYATLSLLVPLFDELRTN